MVVVAEIRPIRGNIFVASFYKTFHFSDWIAVILWCWMYRRMWKIYRFPSCWIKETVWKTNTFLLRTSYYNNVVPPQNAENHSIMGYFLSVVFGARDCWTSFFVKTYQFCENVFFFGERSRHVAQLPGFSHFQAVVHGCAKVLIIPGIVPGIFLGILFLWLETLWE